MGFFDRGSGILLHPTSLPSDYGIGELGGKIFDFLDFLSSANQKYWQVLPLGPTGYGDSPYASFSSFAGNPLLISIEELIDDGLIEKSDINIPEFTQKKVEYGKVIPFKDRVLRIAYSNFKKRTENTKFQQFITDQDDWLHEFAVFMALKEKFDLQAWYEWPEEFHNPESEKVTKFESENKDQITYFKFIQYLFYKQWQKVISTAHQKGIQIIGDIPIFVAYDSADAWANQDLFLMNDDSTLQYVAGVPPDYFSVTGQLWGNPLYDWNRCKDTDYDFWTKRVSRTLELVDIIRIDHFRGFEAYWSVPGEATTAIDGRWVKGPGGDLFEHIKRSLGELPLIAEDLGVITEEVTALRTRFGMPGMKILQYGFSKRKDPSNAYLPHNYEENSVVYTGTHDNDTTLGWYTSAGKEIKQHFIEYADSDEEDIISDMLRLAHSSVANISIIPMQDILRKKSGARMNFPGKAFGNWQWRFEFNELKQEWIDELKNSTIRYKRS